jgi:DNA replication regulator SLD2
VPLTSANTNVQSLRTGPQPDGTPTKRRRLDIPTIVTPQKSRQTPTKSRQTPSRQHVIGTEYDSPQSVRKFLASDQKIIGPTPQKDGLVLGLFDSFSVKRSTGKAKLHTLQATPSKSLLFSPSVKKDPALFLSPSANKISSLLTPLKRKREDAEGGTPFKTPDFLKRSFSLHTKSKPSNRALTEEVDANLKDDNDVDDHFFSPQVAPHKRLAGRRFSAIFAGLKKIEEDRMDEELDMLREAEEEEFRAMSKPKPKNVEVVPETQVIAEPIEEQEIDLSLEAEGHKEPESAPPMFEPFDPNALEIPSSPVSSDSEPDGNTRRMGPQRKSWKKKGQKRTTKRVNMKAIPRAAPSTSASSKLALAGRDPGDGIFDIPASDDVNEEDELNTDTHKVTTQKPKLKEKAASGLQKAKRKISATAHANFRRLKIRSKNAAGGRGRFGRRH